MTPEQLTGQTQSHLTDVMVGSKSFLVHPNVEQDLLSLVNAAQSAGFKLEIASGFRDFERQRLIWNNKFSGKTPILDSHSQPIKADSLDDQKKLFSILRWSALPGASRHHWGCDFDVFARNLLPNDTQLKLEPWEYQKGHQQEFYQWLRANLERHGFYFPYREDLGGVAIEPWHISHRATATFCLSTLSVQVLTKQLALKPVLGQDIIISNLETIYSRFVTNISD